MNPPNLLEEECINEDEDERQRLATLPDHLIFNNILPRLPVKPLIRFKSVCKNWRSTISTPEFSKSHLSFSTSRHQFLLLQKDVRVESSNFYLVRTGFEMRGESTWIRVIGCCNGLLCFYFESSCLGAKKFYVLNPATGQQVEILGPGDECFQDWFNWFGYISSIDDYRIVAFNLHEGVFWTFSWKGGLWKRISCSIDRYGALIKIKSDAPVLVDDCLYWPLNVYKLYANVGTHILEFNLVREEYTVKPRMKFADMREPAVLMNLKGCLAVHVTSHHNCISVWKLKHKDDWNSWEKVVDSKNLRDVALVYYSTTGKLVVIHQKQLKVVEDLNELLPQGEESNKLGKFILRSLPSAEGVRDYVESLISLV
ncbi:F-box/kelch-repeat protein At3g23880-like [Silene latifolia]|uniref:F-box/kelch-repeat protein At3g23880-like n=1 Tax=Silene latifolia TaxID=37657 RepID=UPI003D76A898